MNKKKSSLINNIEKFNQTVGRSSYAASISYSIIGSIITKIILILVFYIILTPLSMLYRMKERKTSKSKVGDSISFWKFRKIDEDSKSILEKLY